MNGKVKQLGEMDTDVTSGKPDTTITDFDKYGNATQTRDGVGGHNNYTITYHYKYNKPG